MDSIYKITQLPLDIKIIIASVLDIEFYFKRKIVYTENCNVMIEEEIYDTPFFKLSQIDDEFHNYIKSNAGITQFINLYSSRYLVGDYDYTYLFGRLHSFYDIAAVITSWRREWYKYGELHREDDLPALIAKPLVHGEFRIWYKNGLIHRIGKPARITKIGTIINEEYFINGEVIDSK